MNFDGVYNFRRYKLKLTEKFLAGPSSDSIVTAHQLIPRTASACPLCHLLHVTPYCNRLFYFYKCLKNTKLTG